MTTITPSGSWGTIYRAPTAPTIRIWPLLLLILTLAAVAYGTHAIIRHGTIAEEIRRCIEQQGPLQTWQNPLTGRSAMICQLPSGMFGLQICEGEQEVTCVPKEKMSRLEQIYQYLKNRGYSP